MQSEYAGESAVSVDSTASKNVLVGVTGSVAAVKLPKLVQQLLLLEPKVQYVRKTSIHFRL